jgi:hypothetical protein
MDAETFTDLALRVLSREATDEERRALETELSAQPARREEFQQWQALRTAAPMVEASRATTPELPTHRLNELRTAVRQHFGPAGQRASAPKTSGLAFPALRWLFAGGGMTVLAVVVLVLFSNQSIEIGLYKTDLNRGVDFSLAPGDVSSSRIVTFEQDAPFDQWQKQPLAWYQHAKIWTDNEHDLLHVVARGSDGKITESTQPLAQSPEAQRDQISQVVASLREK